MVKAGIGIIGCGARMSSVVSKIPGIGEDILVKGIFDPDNEIVEKFVKRFEIDPIIYKDYKELVNRPEINWVFIASWNCFHKEHIIAAARAGKNIFCEKPIAITLEDCAQIKEEVQKAGIQFVMGFTLRYSPHYGKIKQIIEQGEIGDIISMELNETLDFNHGGYIMGDWRRLKKNAGTHLLEKCCHDLDIANWMAGSLPCRVASFGGLNFFRPENSFHIDRIGPDTEGRPAYMTWRPETGLNPFSSDKDIVDNQVGIIEYANGVRTVFHTNCNAGIPERRMLVLGTKGAIRSDVLTGLIQLKRIGFGSSMEDLSAGVSGGHGGGDVVLGQELQDAILHGITPRTGLVDGLYSAVTAFGMDRSMETGVIISMKPLWNELGIEM